MIWDDERRTFFHTVQRFLSGEQPFAPTKELQNRLTLSSRSSLSEVHYSFIMNLFRDFGFDLVEGPSPDNVVLSSVQLKADLLAFS